MSNLKLISLVAGVISAVCWFLSSVVNAGAGKFFWDDGPPWLQRNVIIVKWLNSAAAFMAGVSVLTQAWVE
jgi:hypothetical protein